MRKLNLGCGFDKRDGFVNADGFEQCQPDVLMDIEVHPWPFEDGSFDHILMKHVLEHVGATFDGFKAVMQDLYRVIAPDGIVEIHVPHYRHDSYWGDPTHVRAFNFTTFEMMSKAKNDRWIAQRTNATMLAYAMRVDFEIVEAQAVYDPYWLAKVKDGEMTRDELRRAGEEKWGVVRELKFKLKAIK
jgi:predicted SAM-dependent methyltransferase